MPAATVIVRSLNSRGLRLIWESLLKRFRRLALNRLP